MVSTKQHIILRYSLETARNPETKNFNFIKNIENYAKMENGFPTKVRVDRKRQGHIWRCKDSD